NIENFDTLQIILRPYEFRYSQKDADNFYYHCHSKNPERSAQVFIESLTFIKPPSSSEELLDILITKNWKRLETTSFTPPSDEDIAKFVKKNIRKSLDGYFTNYQAQTGHRFTPAEQYDFDNDQPFGDNPQPVDLDRVFSVEKEDEVDLQSDEFEEKSDEEFEQALEQTEENNIIVDIDNLYFNAWNPQADVPAYQPNPQPYRLPSPPPDLPQNPPVAPPVVPQQIPPVAPPLPPFQPPQQQQYQGEEMSQASYPTFDGTNPRKWIAELELAFIANNLPADTHPRKIGITALHLGPAKMWYVTMDNKPTTWGRANARDGFKELFLAKYATDGNRTQASQQAYARTQRKTESVNDYLNALQEMWLECGDPAVMPEWMKVNQFVHGLLPAIRTPVMQQAPGTMAQAIQFANNCFYAMRASVQPSHSAEVNDALLEEIAALKACTQRMPNQDQGHQTGKKTQLGSTEKEQSRTGKRSATSVEGSDSGNRIRPSHGAKQYGDSDVSGPTYCSAFVEEVESRILVDTGSSVTIISSEHFDLITGKMKKKPILESLNYQIQGVTRHRERPRGEVKNLPLRFKKNGPTWGLNACITEAATADIILGTNFLFRYNAKLNLAKKKLVLNREDGMTESVPLVEKKEMNTRSVNVIEKMDLDPNPNWKCEKGPKPDQCIPAYIPEDQDDYRIRCSKCASRHEEE
ncbi:11042_t:CDS:2, partial [Paraglomus occultum]